MSTEVLSIQQIATPVKQSKSHKRKHADLSRSPAIVPDSQPSPSKRSKRAGLAANAAGETVADSKPDQLLPRTATSPFAVKTLSLYLPLAPIALQTPIPGLCAEHLSPLLLSYYPPLAGVVLSYNNPRLSESPEAESAHQSEQPHIFAASVAEYAASFVWLTADFLILAPQRGVPIDGWINLQSETHLGLLCWNLFSAIIPRTHIPAGWQWMPADGAVAEQKRGIDRSTLGTRDDLDGLAAVDENAVDGNSNDETVVDSDDHGHWEDDRGKRMIGKLSFNFIGLDAFGTSDAEGSLVTIRGTLLDEADEAKVLVEERDSWERRKARRRTTEKKLSSYVMSGARSSDLEKTLEKTSTGVKSRNKTKDEGKKIKDGEFKDRVL